MNGLPESRALREDFFTLAARVLSVPRETLSYSTSRGSIPEWDSVNHLRLVMETEAAFGVHYPLEIIPRLDKLSDFLERL
ncbi:MAG: acyl carrier protein [Kiritimatiellae bacterium]|nr:acyl carrier protein [Kiritimatiellia bacterium]